MTEYKQKWRLMLELGALKLQSRNAGILGERAEPVLYAAIRPYAANLWRHGQHIHRDPRGRADERIKRIHDLWRFRSALTFRSRAVHYNLYLLENSLGWTVIRRTISRLFLFIQFSNVLTAVRRYMPIIYFCFFRPSAIRSANSPVKDNSIIAAPHSSRISPPSHRSCLCCPSYLPPSGLRRAAWARR